MNPELLNNFKDLVGVWDAEVDYFFLDDKKIPAPKHPAIECDSSEASKSNPHRVMEFARAVGAVYNDPQKGELFVVSVKAGSGPHAVTSLELMDMFG
jgi:hypothetical protein